MIRLTLIQERSTNYIGNNHDFTYTLKHPVFNDWSMQQKFRYDTVQEQVKFHVFQVPPSRTGSTVYHTVSITLDPLTPSFYPQIYLNKIEMSSEASN